MRHFSDQLAADKPYYIYTGVEYNTLNLTVAPVGTLTGSFGTIGREYVSKPDRASRINPRDN